MPTPEVKEARRTATILTAMLVVTISSVFYGLSQKGKVEHLQNHVDSLNVELRRVRSLLQ